MTEAQRVAPAPIRRNFRVKATPERAFAIFTGAMGQWWMKGHSLLQGTGQSDVVIEPRDGGRWYETGEDGSEQNWGRVLLWDPPQRVQLAWQLNGEWRYDPDFETTVEVRFTPDGDGTIVDFEHRDLERFGANAAAIRGDYESGMDGGWGQLLARFEEQVAA